VRYSFVVSSTGGWFGEGSLLKRKPRRYDIIALRDTHMALMPRSSFAWLVATQAEVAALIPCFRVNCATATPASPSLRIATKAIP
jgi:CRP-like cAMP-binding protein